MKKTYPKEREREIGIFSMIGFDSETSSFLALLVNKSYRKKLTKAKFKKHFKFAVKKFKTVFFSKILSSNSSLDTNRRKNQKRTNFENFCN